MFDISLEDQERDERASKEDFTHRNRLRMRYILLIVPSERLFWPQKLIFDDALWSAILPNLRGLRIIAHVPIKKDRDFEERLESWVQNTRPYLQCFGQHLSERTTVQIDYNGETKARTLMDECLPHGYREIRCRRTGDCYFERGRWAARNRMPYPGLRNLRR
ncbi:hypothetical protein K491DRAFT_90292 [Lophiostoma macrostomum CBS 122681]|uniref:Uncharacterized protein n=1 Tax=Lophiostoma macrostomum CBS 122681 TaxID=1314788 RepID=A0A6A6SY40_9PLEO|nr:hypothetical protein K491DRAFT_90292 [Lophiostoma macrostomum CBS 122681]